MSLWLWLGIAVGIVLIGVIAYWLLIITEGTYLGQPIVTWMYDIVANRYDNIKGFDAETEAAYLARPLLAELRQARVALILDIGTGTGRLPLTLFEQAQFQGRVIGIDDSEAMMAIAATKLAGYRNRCLLIHRSAVRLPLVDAAVDAVTMLEMLEFTPNPETVLREAFRVLRPGGLLLATRRTGLDAKLMPGKTYSVDAFCQLLTNLGLTQVRVQRWQVDYDLVWATRPGNLAVRYSNPLEVLACTKCGTPAYQVEDTAFVCQSCGHQAPLVNNIVKMNS